MVSTRSPWHKVTTLITCSLDWAFPVFFSHSGGCTGVVGCTETVTAAHGRIRDSPFSAPLVHMLLSLFLFSGLIIVLFGLFIIWI